jgi:hypothetical protein
MAHPDVITRVAPANSGVREGADIQQVVLKAMALATETRALVFTHVHVLTLLHPLMDAFYYTNMSVYPAKQQIKQQ